MWKVRKDGYMERRTMLAQERTRRDREETHPRGERKAFELDVNNMNREDTRTEMNRIGDRKGRKKCEGG